MSGEYYSRSFSASFYSNVIEYEWPKGSMKYFILQDHLSRYLNIKAFHRKFENLKRRNVSPEEKNFLLENGIISLVEANFRLVALKYAQVLKFMRENYNDKYHIYYATLRQREINSISRAHADHYDKICPDNSDQFYLDSIKESVRYNAHLQKDRINSRPFDIDINMLKIFQPREVGTPKLNFLKDLDPYPISLTPWQYQTNFIRFTPSQLNTYLSFEKPIPNDTPPNNENIPILTTVKPKGKRGRKPKARPPIEEQPHEESRILVVETTKTEIPNSDMLPDEGVIENNQSEHVLCAECSIVNPIFDQYMITCNTCKKTYHAICMDVSLRLVDKVNSYEWDCYYCKKCSICGTSKFSSKMLLCDACDRSYHSDCLEITEIPLGRWVCNECGICSSCLRRRPDRSGWIEERNDRDNLIQVHCARCSSKYQSGAYCPVCMEAHWNLLETKYNKTCNKCKFQIHPECQTPELKSCLLCSGILEKRPGL